MGGWVLHGWGGDGDRSNGDGVEMTTVFMGMAGDRVQSLSPCRPLV